MQKLYMSIASNEKVTCDIFLASAFQQNDYNFIKILPSTLFLSYSLESMDPRVNKNYCSKYKGQAIPFKSEAYKIEEIVFPCKDTYPLSFGINHEELGNEEYEKI